MKARHLLASLLLPVASCALAERFAASADEQEVTDTKTGLVWRRCVEGMRASGGTCIGTASTFKHHAALEHANTQGAVTGIPWRLPNVKELASIVDKSQINPAIDTLAFPATPASWVWSSSPYVGSAGSAWYGNFVDGRVNSTFRGSTFLQVRLVRAGL
jgi:hypothetical protein